MNENTPEVGPVVKVARDLSAITELASGICIVCSQPLPKQEGPGRRRKLCRDEDSPTPGGCAKWRNSELTHRKLTQRPSARISRPNPFALFPNGGFLIE